MIHPSDTSVVKGHNFVAMSLQAVRPKIGAIPEVVQIARARGSDIVRAQHLQAILFGIVRGVRVHEVQPQEERSVAVRTKPGEGVIDNNIRGRESAECIQGIGRSYSPALAILKIQLVIECAQ
jgi:hypothetical protein